MAVEIREVIVRAILSDGGSESATPADGASAPAGDSCSSPQSPENVVTNVVDQVLRILERRKLR
jgi:hypothetical protein